MRIKLRLHYKKKPFTIELPIKADFEYNFKPLVSFKRGNFTKIYYTNGKDVCYETKEGPTSIEQFIKAMQSFAQFEDEWRTEWLDSDENYEYTKEHIVTTMLRNLRQHMILGNRVCVLCDEPYFETNNFWYSDEVFDDPIYFGFHDTFNRHGTKFSSNSIRQYSLLDYERMIEEQLEYFEDVNNDIYNHIKNNKQQLLNRLTIHNKDLIKETIYHRRLHYSRPQKEVLKEANKYIKTIG